MVKLLNSRDSKGTAERRSWSLKRSMLKDPDKFEKGFKEVEKFLTEGKAKDVTAEDDKETKRNVLVESGRIARGTVLPLADLNIEDIDAIIIPGGFGAAKNLCSFATRCPI